MGPYVHTYIYLLICACKIPSKIYPRLDLERASDLHVQTVPSDAPPPQDAPFCNKCCSGGNIQLLSSQKSQDREIGELAYTRFLDLVI